MNKRIFALLSLIVAASMAFAACGPKSEPTAGPVQGPMPAPTATVEVEVVIVCVILDKAPMPTNNELLVTYQSATIGKILFDPATLAITVYDLITGDMLTDILEDPGKVVVSIPVNDYMVVVTELTMCNGELFYDQYPVEIPPVGPTT